MAEGKERGTERRNKRKSKSALEWQQNGLVRKTIQCLEETGHRIWTQIVFSSSKEWIFPEPFKFFYPVPHVIYDKCGGRIIIITTATSSIYQMLDVGQAFYSLFNPHNILVRELLPSPSYRQGNGVLEGLCEGPKVK